MASEDGQQESKALVKVQDDSAPDDHRQAWILAGETHTLGNALRDVMWSHPHIQLASYTQEHPSSSDILLRCQTSGAISAEQGLAEALEITQLMLRHMGQAMEGAVAAWAAQHPAALEQGGGGSGGAAAAAAAAVEDSEAEAEEMEEDS